MSVTGCMDGESAWLIDLGSALNADAGSGMKSVECSVDESVGFPPGAFGPLMWRVASTVMLVVGRGPLCACRAEGGVVVRCMCSGPPSRPFSGEDCLWWLRSFVGRLAPLPPSDMDAGGSGWAVAGATAASRSCQSAWSTNIHPGVSKWSPGCAWPAGPVSAGRKFTQAFHSSRLPAIVERRDAVCSRK